MGLSPVTFMWKTGDHRRKRMGFIAQDVSTLCKSIGENLSLVTASYKPEGDEEVSAKEYFGEDVDDELLTWGMAHEDLIAPIVKVLQIQQERIKELQAQVAALSNLVDHKL